MENTAVIETQAPSEPVVVEKNEVLEASCKRALEEMSALQMTQQVLAMIEQSMQKPAVKEYNSAGVKKYLHELFTLSPDASSEEINGMEFIYWQEIQLWRSALSQRDGFISASDLRYYCESSKPPLSEQALLALARFYRGLPASERTTSKFDMILTRIFSIDEENGLRRLSATRSAVAETLEDFYKDWLGISPQHAIEDEKISKAASKFSEFITRAGDAPDFETLIGESFFGVIKDYKKELSQIFYAPEVAAAAIDCNIKVGNRFVELLDQYREQEKAEGKKISESLDPLLEQIVSETTNKTLRVVYEAKKNHSKLQQQRERQRLLEKETFVVPETKKVRVRRPVNTGSLLGVNIWLLVIGFAAILSSGMLYLWVQYSSPENLNVQAAQKLNEKELPGGEFLMAARVSNNAFYGVVTTKWNALTEDGKKKVIDQLISAGKEKGYSQVALLNTDGKLIGRASEKGTNLF
jgi:hypothetical protein